MKQTNNVFLLIIMILYSILFSIMNIFKVIIFTVFHFKTNTLSLIHYAKNGYC